MTGRTSFEGRESLSSSCRKWYNKHGLLMCLTCFQLSLRKRIVFTLKNYVCFTCCLDENFPHIFGDFILKKKFPNSTKNIKFQKSQPFRHWFEVCKNDANWVNFRSLYCIEWVHLLVTGKEKKLFFFSF